MNFTLSHGVVAKVELLTAIDLQVCRAHADSLSLPDYPDASEAEMESVFQCSVASCNGDVTACITIYVPVMYLMTMRPKKPPGECWLCSNLQDSIDSGLCVACRERQDGLSHWAGINAPYAEPASGGSPRAPLEAAEVATVPEQPKK